MSAASCIFWLNQQLSTHILRVIEFSPKVTVIAKTQDGHTFDKKYVYFVYQKCLKCVFGVNTIMCFTGQIIRSRVSNNYIS